MDSKSNVVKRTFDLIFALLGLIILGWLILILWGLASVDTVITTSHDPRISKFGKILRNYKLDELPQLINVFIGRMSFVGPRPDVPGYADKLKGENRKVLELRPGITGPASLKYENEEEILAKVDHPEKYNDEIIYPDKVRINLEYYYNHNLFDDIKLIFQTIF